MKTDPAADIPPFPEPAATTRAAVDPAGAAPAMVIPPLDRTNHELANLQRELASRNAELAATQLTLQQQHSELRVLLDLMPAMVWFKDTTNGIRLVNQRVADHAKLSIGEIEGKASADIYPGEAAKFYADDLEVIRSGVPKLGYVESLPGPDGEHLWLQTDKVPYFDRTGKVVGVVVMAQDVTGRKRGEQELEETHRRLLEVSRLGGMAEVATIVLHSVGNVLKRVNVSVSLVMESIGNSRAVSLAKVVALLHEHMADLGSYITSDPRGRHIPTFLEQISQDWLGQQQTLTNELQSLRANVEHINSIVAKQQRYAEASGVAEIVDVRQLVEDSLSLKEAVLSEHHVRVIREFAEVPSIIAEKQKVLQILINLVSNARRACDEQNSPDKHIILRIAQADGRSRISVSDNGVGIAPENLTRIFAHGFTTRTDGSGFGLHNGALVAAELGGSLRVHSDGLGKGATFTLELPQQPPPGARA